MQQIFSGVKTDAAGADQGHGLAHLALVPKYIQITHHLGVPDAFDLRHARAHACGQHHLFEAGRRQVFGTDALVQLQCDPGQVNLLSKVAQGFMKLFFAGHLFGHVELTTDFAGAIKQGYIKAAPGGRGGKSQTGRPCAHHSNAFFGWSRGFNHQRLVAGARIDQAGGELAAKGVVQASLVAGDAGVDFVRFAKSRFVDKFGIGQERAGHGDHVSHAVGQNLFSNFGGIDAVGGDHRNADLALEFLCHPCKSSSGHFGGNGRDAGFMPANAGVQNAHASSFQGLGQLQHFFMGRAAFNQVEHGETKNDDEIRTHFGTGAAYDFDWKCDTVFIVATPCVFALVGLCGNELVDQVAFRAHDFYAVVAGALCQIGGIHIVFNRLLDLFAGQRMRAKHIDRGLQGTGCHQIRVVGIASEMQDLHGDLAAGVMHCLGHHFVFISFCLGRHAGTTGHGAGTVIGCYAACDDQADAAFGSFCIKSSHACKTVLGFLQTHMHGAHDHAVFQSGKAQVQGGEHVGVGGHLGGPMGNQTLVTQFTKESSKLQLT